MVEKWALLKRRKISLETLVTNGSKELDVIGEEVTGSGRRRAISVARSVFCQLATRELVDPGRQLSEALQIIPCCCSLLYWTGGEDFTEEQSLERAKNYLNNLTT